MNVRAALFVVVIPVGFMATWLLSLVVALTQAQEVTLAVKGYDPRDLLSGHYLRYQVDYGSGDLSFSYGEAICVCLPQTSEATVQASWIGECNRRDHATCPLFIKGVASYRGIKAGIERYFIPEEYSDVLSRIPQDATIKVRVTTDGTSLVTGMFVGGVPILEWAKAQGAKPH